MRRVLKYCALSQTILSAALGLSAPRAFAEEIRPGQSQVVSSQQPCLPQPLPPDCCYPIPGLPSTMPGSGGIASPGTGSTGSGTGDGALPSFASTASGAGLGSSASLSPNMFGDQFSNNVLRIFLPQFSRTVSGAIVDTSLPPPNTNAQFVGSNGSGGLAQFSPQSSTLTYGGKAIPGTLLSNTPFISSIPTNFAVGYTPPSPVPLQENTAFTGFVQSQIAKPGETATFVAQPTASFAQGLSSNGPYTTPLYTVNQAYQLTTQAAVLNVANPSGGGVVGRQKMSEDNNPLPRDRFIFDFDYFNSTPLGNGVDVSRFVFGFEKTFCDQRASIEVRIPCASTLASDQTTGLQSTDVQFGDIRITPKVLLWGGDCVNVATGLGIYLPTASDTRVYTPDGVDRVRINNDSWLVSPFVGVLLMPNDRLFGQVWLAFDVDTNGNPVLVNPDGNGLQGVGRIRTAPQMQWDFQFGYWLTHLNENGRGFGLAPFIELHSGVDLQNVGTVSYNSFQIGDLSGQTDELNLAAGLIMQIESNVYLSTGVVVPLLDQSNRSFDFQIGVRLNILFGPSAGGSASSGVSQF